MSLFTEKTTLIIPTRNRHKNLINLLSQIKLYKIKFFEILIIDSSDRESKSILKKNSKKFKYKYFHTQSSTSYQRNFGLKKRNRFTKFVMFLDDDVIFFKDTFYEMNKTIKKFNNNSSVKAFGFNQIDIKYKKDFFEKLKSSKLIKLLGIYSDKPGSVLISGWHTKILNLKKDSYVDWIYTTACVYNSNAINNLKFNETFGQYSYLEDLDFSLNLRNFNNKIIVSSSAKFMHPLNIDRSSFYFGITEVVNRYKIVDKYKLQKKNFYFMVCLRFFFSISLIFFLKVNLFKRAIGNIFGIFKCMKLQKSLL